MLKQLIKNFFIKTAQSFGWEMILIPKNSNKRITATKADLGFWYTGDVFSSSDIAYGIYRNGLVEKTETDLVVDILKQISTQADQINFYDIGANSGYYGILAAHLGKGKTKTFSFEPLSEYASLIEESVNLNRLDNQVKIFRTALGDKETIATIELAGSGSSLVPGFLGARSNNPKREIPVSRLDEVVVKQSLPLPHFIKIDVEGFELEVLQGSQKTLAEALPILFIEVANTLKRADGDFVNKSANQVFDLLTGLGYNAYIVKGKIEPTTAVSSDSGVYMYLFLNKTNPLHETLSNTLR
jgi:FkbM family methyltransferase